MEERPAADCGRLAGTTILIVVSPGLARPKSPGSFPLPGHPALGIFRVEPQLRNSVLMKTMDALRSAMAEVDAYYKERGIFQDRFGFGASPALIVIDMAYGWTDP